jgi:hypothetical protein
MSNGIKPSTESTTPTCAEDGHTTNQVFATVTDIGTGKIYTDQTGKFSVLSSRGNKYLFVLYDYEILTRAYKKLFNQLKKRCLRPQVQLLDNECFQSMKDLMDELNVQRQLTPAGIHRRNAAERKVAFIRSKITYMPAWLRRQGPPKLLWWSRVLVYPKPTRD